MRKSLKSSNALPVPRSAAEEFGPLFAVLDEAKALQPRRVVDLDKTDGEFVSWRLFMETEDGIVLRDGVHHWMEETLWVLRRTPGRTFALRYQGHEYEFDRVLARRSIHAEPASDENQHRSRGRRAAA